jgi:hypothetical protein
MRHPLLKFYRGFFVTMLGMIPYAGISFLSWEFLRARFLPNRNREGKGVYIFRDADVFTHVMPARSSYTVHPVIR